MAADLELRGQGDIAARQMVVDLVGDQLVRRVFNKGQGGSPRHQRGAVAVKACRGDDNKGIAGQRNLDQPAFCIPTGGRNGDMKRFVLHRLDQPLAAVGYHAKATARHTVGQ